MKKILPGVLLSLAIAIIATILNQYVHIIGARCICTFSGDGP